MKNKVYVKWIGKNNRVFENTYFMMVVPSWSTVCNDRIENEVRA